jgi:hypothetical protein
VHGQRKPRRPHAQSAQAGQRRRARDRSKESTCNPIVATYTVEQPLTIPAGDVLEVECEYFNDTDQPLRFPSEMCVAWSYQFPADHEIDCVDGTWPGA